MFNFIIFFVAVNIILAAILILLSYKIYRLEKKYNLFISKFNSEENIEMSLQKYIEMVKNVNEENKINRANYLNIERKIEACIQNIGFIRYNAFDDVGNELSFVIALLDNNDNGFIINSIYGKNYNTIYSKKIESGTSIYPLTEEEITALNKAKDNKKL